MTSARQLQRSQQLRSAKKPPLPKVRVPPRQRSPKSGQLIFDNYLSLEKQPLQLAERKVSVSRPTLLRAPKLEIETKRRRSFPRFLRLLLRYFSRVATLCLEVSWASSIFIRSSSESRLRQELARRGLRLSSISNRHLRRRLRSRFSC